VNAPAVIVVHNHPSGDPPPSPEDVRATEHLITGGNVHDIDMLDHIVLGREGRYVCMQEHGLVRRCIEPLAAYDKEGRGSD